MTIFANFDFSSYGEPLKEAGGGLLNPEGICAAVL